MRGFVAGLTFAACLAAAAPAAGAAHLAAAPRFQLLGDWGFHGQKYRFTRRSGLVSGRSLERLRIGRCVVRAGTEVFRGYRFRGSRAGSEVWQGELALVGGAGCKRTLVPSTIEVASDLRFTESSTLADGSRPPPSTFIRIRPPTSLRDPVIGTWLRNGAGVVVTLEGRLFVGRAREAFGIANGCIVKAGTIVWRMRPLAPDRYSGTIQAFFGPPACAPASLDPSTWLFPGSGHSQLVRRSPQGQRFPYARG